jgi:hypothetical protein
MHADESSLKFHTMALGTAIPSEEIVSEKRKCEIDME